MITDKASKVIARMAFITDKDISYDHQGYIGKDIWLLKPGLFTIHHMIKDVTAKTSSIKGAIRRMTSGRGWYLPSRLSFNSIEIEFTPARHLEN